MFDVCGLGNDDKTPPFQPQEKNNKTKQNGLTLIC